MSRWVATGMKSHACDPIAFIPSSATVYISSWRTGLDGQLGPGLPEPGFGRIDRLHGPELFPGLVPGAGIHELADHAEPDRSCRTDRTPWRASDRPWPGPCRWTAGGRRPARHRPGPSRDSWQPPRQTTRRRACPPPRAVQVGHETHGFVSQDLAGMLLDDGLQLRRGLVELSQLPQGLSKHTTQGGIVPSFEIALRDLPGLRRPASIDQVQFRETSSPCPRRPASAADALRYAVMACWTLPWCPRAPIHLRTRRT